MIQADRFALDDLNVDLARQLADNLHVIDLRQLLQPIVSAAEVDPENVLAFTQFGSSQDLLALKGPVRLHFNVR